MRKLLLLLLLSPLCFVASGQDDFKIEYGPYLYNVTENEATVVWVTNNDAVSWVDLAPDDGSNFYSQEWPRFFNTHIGKKAIGTLHKVTLTGLEKGTTYRYRVFSQEVTGRKNDFVTYGRVKATDVYRGKPYSFTTADKSGQKVSFAMLSDIHENNDLQKSLIAQVDMGATDFVVFNGDMANRLNSEEHMFAAYLQTASKLYAAETPIVYARGNHETRGEYSHRFMDYFPSPTGLPYYAFRNGPAFFIILDGGEDKTDNDIEYYGTAMYDDYRSKQAEWLKGVVESDDFRTAPVKIAVMHVPPVRATWHGAIDIREKFLPYLNGAGIDIMLSGHLHKHIYIPPGQDGCDFPVLINSNKHVLITTVEDGKTVVKVKDGAGKLVEEIEL